MEGTGTGTSLKLELYSSDGDAILEQIVSLEILRAPRFEGPFFRMEVREDLLQDANLLSEVVEMAFSPVLVPSRGFSVDR